MERLAKPVLSKDRNVKYKCILCLCQIENDCGQVTKSLVSFIAFEVLYSNEI